MTGWHIRVRGLVQGVGFRPTVWRIAKASGLYGEVFNDAEGVVIKIRASIKQRDRFINAIKTGLPPLANIDELEITPLDNVPEWKNFAIIESGAGQVTTGIVPDAATCSDCLAEITDETNKRFGYAFTNCTNCGPRLSITHAIPYDRANTSMAKFTMCSKCQHEYDDPSDRRFHAQPNACPDCGPRLWLEDKNGEVAGDPIITAAKALKAGKIVAIKGLGGFQLAVDAGNETAVELLRERKRRPAKPLALMARDIDMAARFVMLDSEAQKALAAPQSPIVLAHIAGEALPDAIAPKQNRLGFMLPNTPLHHLLMRQLQRPIVLTSGNFSDEPQVIDNLDARQKLGKIADLWLMHDRDIINRLDDSVVQIISDSPQILRRARGYAPAPLILHKGFSKAPSILAMGADIKNSFCLLTGGKAIISQHIGDMESPQTQRDFIANLALYQDIYGFTPAFIACDLHQGYFSTRRAEQLGAKANIDVQPVQHHHAHIAAVLAEHGFAPDCEPVLGIVLDGLGFGSDGNIWGGEFLLANFKGFERLANFASIPLLGGEKANYQPWRNALAHLQSAFGIDAISTLSERYGALPIFEKLAKKPIIMLDQMLARGLNVPLASSAGRLFDALAAVLGVEFEQVLFEGQAAMMLQVMAETCPRETGYYSVMPTPIIKWHSLWEGVLGDLQKGVPNANIAKKFHNSLSHVISQVAIKLCKSNKTDIVVLTGGVFQNGLLLEMVQDALLLEGIRVLTPSIFPVNDGGIALGQATITAAIIDAL